FADHRRAPLADGVPEARALSRERTGWSRPSADSPPHISEEFHMRKILFGSTALLLSLVVLGKDSPEMAVAQEPAPSPPVTAQLVANLDLNKAAADASTAITSQRDRGAWVRALLEQLKSKTQGKLNIMVFNMEQGFVFNPPPGTFKFTKATFK